jgi:hypothetical protein
MFLVQAIINFPDGSEEEKMWRALMLLPDSYRHPHPDGMQTPKTPVKPDTLYTLQTCSK